ncbi:MAG: hypothetical protein R3B48_30965 [Kofleriaceae bacterium]
MKIAISTLVALATLTTTSHAHAQAQGAEAETLFRQGKALMAKGQFAEACAAFDASQNLESSLSTLLNLANCREKNNQLATAWGIFLKVQQQTRAATDDISKQLRDVATDRASKLEPRLSTMTITVPAEAQVPGLEVLRDGVVIAPGAWNRALPIDGGSYKLSARAPGNAEWSSMITVAAERDAKTIEIPKLKEVTIEPSRGEGEDGREEATKPEVPVSPPRPRSKVVPLALAGASVAFAGGAVGFALWGDSTYDRAKKEPNDAKQTSLWHDANTRRYVAEGLAVASVVTAGVSVWLYLRKGSPERAEKTASRLRLAPVVTDDHAGVFVLGRY